MAKAASPAKGHQTMSKKISKSAAARALNRAGKQASSGSRKERSGRVLHEAVAVKTTSGPVKAFRLGNSGSAETDKKIV